MPRASCYHCGLPIPDDVDLSVKIGGEQRAMCCFGCQAVAQSIVENGLEDYYRSRDSLPESPREAMPAVLDQLALFDHAEFQKSFVKELGQNEREASLLLEGITCAACIWLNEQHVGRLPGVTAVDINYATRRARVRWDETRVKLSDILGAIAAIGYRAYPYDAAKNEEISQKERRDALWRLWVAGFGMMQVMMYAYPVYIADGDMAPDIESLMRWASLLLTMPVIFYSSAPFFRNAWRDIKLRRVGMDVPVALGVGAAFLASCWATFMQAGEVYFDSVTMFIFFLLGGRYLEMTARQKALSVTEALAKLLPAFAQKMPGFPGDRTTEQCVVADLRPGDYVLVRAGDIVPADGRVIDGISCANESLLTGESKPVPKAPGETVTGGAINAESPLVVQVEQVGEGTRLSAIIQLMERAAAEKPKIVELADRIASYFVAVLLAVAIFVAVGWYFVDPSKALWITVSVLVVTCPCALSLATPIALTVSAGALAKDGLLVTRGHAIETLARATHFVFDKTGTLTTGRMHLVDVLPVAGLNRDECLLMAAALEHASEHPVATALRRAAGAQLPDTSSVLSEPGLGIEAIVAGRRCRIGRPGYALALGQGVLPEAVHGWLESGDTVVFLGDESGCLALFRIGDELRPESAALISELRAAGKKVVLLSGDAAAVVSRVAATLGIDDVRADITPQGKHDCVKALQAEGALVAMVGDGVNDAPVLAQAQVSVAMGGGAQLARTQSDFVLLSENLDHLRLGLRRARKTLLVIRQNLWWSFAYNFVALPLAIGGYVTPWLAGIGMSASSLLVVLNSLRIQRVETD
ncbi:heavy metal translocating P-type ATPase [Ferribacterium limneticum]|uniref:heavy metal translocating P-type ATPase n=1 Tax=Ferribacterium limneticum TaxID=76259 RepID=UPI001CFBA8B0|nr:heavy metal translocating P-type ATPase [Ferribacterium limneticum]UCV27708.1 heavy metal translocating P-type ATPase [Ferribacterium limneticum]UCV31625.1 heavy metal translocating P-type ATPase [Ferribacterium limneticum]